MLEEPDVDTTVFPDLGDGAGDDDIVINSLEFYHNYLSKRDEDIDDMTSGQSSSSETDGNSSGVDLFDPSSGTSSEWDSGKDDSTVETDSETESDRMEVEKTPEGDKTKAASEVKGRLIRKTVPRSKKYFRGNETEGEDSSESEDSGETKSNTLLDDFKKRMEILSEDENDEYESAEDEEQHKWKFTGEFTIGGVNYRPSDYVEVSTNDGTGSMFCHIKRISIEEDAEVVECKCFKLYRPRDTILGNISRYCHFNPKELFLYYPDERSCRETIHGKDIKRRITVKKQP